MVMFKKEKVSQESNDEPEGKWGKVSIWHKTLITSIETVDNGYNRATTDSADLSRCNELPNDFQDRSRWLGLLLNDNRLQGGQHFCCSAANILMQGRHNKSCKVLRKVEILHGTKWA